MLRLESSEGKNARKLIFKFILSITLLPILMFLFPNAVPFRFFEFWHIQGGLFQWLFAAWPIFAWGTSVTILYSIFTHNDPDTNREAESIIIYGLLFSVFAGVAEEILFRWLFFLLDIFFVRGINFIFFGWIGFGVLEWTYLHIFGPLANVATLRGLEEYLFHPAGWTVGAAILSANAFFRDGHKYEGMFGWINSWFMGMYLFWIMFTYGLVAAIVVHFLYDLFLFLVRYIDAAIERSLGWV